MHGSRSAERLLTCHEDLQRVITRVVELGPDFIVVCGHRTQEEQEQAVQAGNSQRHWPEGRHNSMPSTAVDLAPCAADGSVDWKDHSRFRTLAGYVLAAGDFLAVPLVWGGTWEHDGADRFDESRTRFHDLGHFELADGR